MKVREYLLVFGSVLFLCMALYAYSGREPVARDEIVRIEGIATSGYCVTSRSLNSMDLFVSVNAQSPTKYIIILSEKHWCSDTLVARIVRTRVVLYQYKDWTIGLEVDGQQLMEMESLIREWETGRSAIGFLVSLSLTCFVTFVVIRRKRTTTLLRT